MWLLTTIQKYFLEVLALPMLIGVPSVAEASSLSNWLSSPTMTGDWGGARTRLLDDGFAFHGVYVGEYANSFSGGMRQGGDYAQQFLFGSDVDLQKIANISGGTFHIGFIQREGRSTSADYTGNEILVQEQYGSGENFRITALNYEQKLLISTEK